MASQATIPLFKVHGIQIGTDSTKEPEMHQVQLQLKNGRRFVLRGLITPVYEECETAIRIINEDKCVNLSEFVEVKPAKNSEAYHLMSRKGYLKQFQYVK